MIGEDPVTIDYRDYRWIIVWDTEVQAYRIGDSFSICMDDSYPSIGEAMEEIVRQTNGDYEIEERDG